jgi:hypothetical protein
MIGSTSNSNNVYEVVDDNSNSHKSMIIDVIGMNQDYAGQYPIIDEEPNADTTKFFDLLKDSDEPLWDECTNHNKLLIVARVFTIKSDRGLSEADYDIIFE